MRLSEHEWQTAQQVCTPEQLQALDYWRHGYGYKRIGAVLELSSDSARDRVKRGLGAIKRARR